MPLLETEQHKIILAPIAPREVENGVLVYTERQNKDGSGSRLVPYEVDCAGARVRKQGEAEEWFKAKPFTLANSLLERVCRKRR